MQQMGKPQQKVGSRTEAPEAPKTLQSRRGQRPLRMWYKTSKNGVLQWTATSTVSRVQAHLVRFGGRPTHRIKKEPGEYLNRLALFLQNYHFILAE